MTEFHPPFEWLRRFGSQLKDFYDFQCQEAKRILEGEHKSILRSVRKNANQATLSASVQKTTKVNSFV